MAVALYMDVHVPFTITEQLRRRSVNVLTSYEDGCDKLEDDELLQHCHELKRLLFTQDIRFKALAQSWQQTGRDFSGLLFGHQLGGTLGQYVRDLELIAKASDQSDWMNRVEHLPLP